MVDEIFNGLLDYLSQNNEKIFGSLVKEKDEVIRILMSCMPLTETGILI